MNNTLKASADALYEKARLASDQTRREEQRTFVETMASRRTNRYMPLSGPEFQSLARVSGKHIERCIRERFYSYQHAYQRAEAAPTDAELREILSDVKRTEEQENRHAATALQQFALTHGLSTGQGTGIDSAATIRGQYSGVHDQVVQDWHVWRTDIALRAQTLQNRQKLQPVPKTGWETLSGRARSWPAVVFMASVLLSFAGNAIYAGDVRATFWLCSISLFLLTARFITWDLTKTLPFKDGANAAAMVVAIC